MPPSDVIELRAHLDPKAVRPNVPSDLTCLFELEARSDLPAASTALRTNVCLVFDCSGSMVDKKREAAIAELGPGDMVGEMALLMKGGRRTATARARGEGFPGGFGLAGITERVASCGGTLTVGPTAAGGFAVTARLPAR